MGPRPNQWLLSDAPTLALRCAAKPKHYIKRKAKQGVSMKNYFYILVLMLSVPNLASADDSSSLLFDGGIGSLIALRDNFFIEYSDQVSDGCLPQPSKMEDKMELALRKNGFSISAEKSFFPNVINITALGFGTNDYSCAIHVEADLIFYANVAVPYAQEMEDGSTTFAPVTYTFGSTMLTGRKNGMQGRIEETVKEFGDNLYLQISRSRDELADNFPEILEYHAKQNSQNN